jgi:anti-anti-sigma factor
VTALAVCDLYRSYPRLPALPCQACPTGNISILERFMDSSAEPAPMGGPPLTVTCALGSPSVVTVAGEADLDGLDLLQNAVDRALGHHPHLVFDLARVTFADSTFLSLLIQTRLTALEQDGSVRLLAPSSSVHHLLSLTGAVALFPVTTPEQLRHS